MRKLVSFMHVSLDGFVAGVNGELDWVAIDGEAMQYASKLSHAAGAAVYGRNVYEMMKSYWPSVLDNPNATEQELDHARWVQDIPKIVVSTTLAAADWNNTILIKSNIHDAFTELKKQSGNDLLIFGSPRLTYSLVRTNLVDEYVIFLNPVVLGQGIPQFKDVQKQINLQLLETHLFKSGVMVLRYAVKHG